MRDAKDADTPMSPSTPSCPQCAKPMVLPQTYAPFCSLRCKELDLYRWLDEDYRIEEVGAGGEATLGEILEEGF